MDWDALLRHLEAAPMDDFLHQHLVRRIAAMTPDARTKLETASRQADGRAGSRAVLAGLLMEYRLLADDTDGKAMPDGPAPEPEEALALAPHSPAVCLRAWALPDHRHAAAWSALFQSNICGHHPLPAPEDVDIPPIHDAAALESARCALYSHRDALKRHHDALRANPEKAHQARPPARETCLRALDALMENDILDGPEMRHEASLSPIALLRGWRVDLRVENGAIRHTLRGSGTAYGRGLSVTAARTSCAM